MPVTILSKSERQKAEVYEDRVRYYRSHQSSFGVSGWTFVRETQPAAPFHVVLDMVHDILNGPPVIYRR